MITANDSNTAHIQKTTLGANALFASAQPSPFFPPLSLNCLLKNCEPFFLPSYFLSLFLWDGGVRAVLWSSTNLQHETTTGTTERMSTDKLTFTNT